MTRDTDGEFPFDFWAKLAQQDPGAFEEARRLMVESLIESAPARVQPRLKGLQWQIDHVRRRAPTPLSACLKISNMMWNNVLGEDGLSEHLQSLSGGRPLPARPPATVLPLRRGAGEDAEPGWDEPGT